MQLAVHSNFKCYSLLYFVKGFRKETREVKRKGHREKWTLLGTWGLGPVKQTWGPKMYMWSKVYMALCA